MNWNILVFGLGAAFFQAAYMALKKKALQFKGINNFIGFASFVIAGVAIAMFMIAKGQTLTPVIENTQRFWQGVFWSVLPNTIAMYFLYRALDIADLSHLMPFIAFTTIFQIIPPIFVFGEIPTTWGFLGMAIIIAGAVMMEYKKKTATAEINNEKKRNNRKGIMFFMITLLCWVATPTGFKMVVEQTNPIYASAIISLFIGLSFIPLIFSFKESGAIRRLIAQGSPKVFLIAIVFAGLFTAGDYLAMNFGYSLTKVAYIMALKRAMPFFAFLIGYFYFKEKSGAARKLIATTLMIGGVIIISFWG